MKNDQQIYFFKLSPFLLLYLIFVIVAHNDEFVGDEARYFQYATNLLKGYYSPPGEAYLWNGPGYPIFLMPFIYFNLPLQSITIINAIMHFASVVLLFYTLTKLVKEKIAFYISIFWGGYFTAFQEMPFILTESLTIFLCTLFLYVTQIYFLSLQKSYLFLSGLVLGLLILTKIIFGYVILVLAFLYLILFIFNLIIRFNAFWRPIKELKILLIAQIVCIPYLMYTYQITGKPLYFGNSGGMNLYWMSTPFEDEYGDWINDDFFKDKALLSGNIYKNHATEINQIKQGNWIVRDSLYKSIGLANIKNKPLKFAKNIIYNVGRLWFNFPLTAYPHSGNGVFRLFLNSILLTFFLISLIYWALNFQKLNPHLNFISLMLLTYLGLSSLVSALPRQLSVSVPWIIFFCSIILIELHLKPIIAASNNPHNSNNER